VRVIHLLIAVLLACAAPTVAGELEGIIGKTPPGRTQVQDSAEPRAIPKAWGRLVTVTVHNGVPFFYFEAADGTIRRVSVFH